ncbi:similar to Saccharomyces cerevisiae YPL269W KAR9 Karyogamy protein required for correct positioning of the mitotic spindle and for orienting cytoplasmic microtubules [Maudiozyma saulgeensis]|uniref:Similar to Saccharomyces cerevisiae YPL269W KAR9 Karyogamy protein required for correct positioning of the mitotic spindle and for orienting cytoplasmic microtubules n=1 Tax=Maudiozyma saulgeensis TaxID=1789683 RepID=A0A1X7QZN9_9SACH|nr:similar to Saccharomyces cerevisiae YPL269W KAR9 Karyogamy protein required for correct positioning of the mitotic spindle and for orienting cytoplasmic microtubules [Kazachstania saulgeensis]
MIGEEKATLDSAVARISSLLIRLGETERVNEDFYNDLTKFYDELYGLNKILAAYLNLDPQNFLNEMAIVASLKDIFSEVAEQFESIEPILCDIVDLIDKDDAIITLNSSEIDPTTIAQLLKECNEVTKNNKSVMKSLKDIIGTYLDFNEILDNHIGTIDDIVNESLNQLFEIYEERNGSPIRHYPLFTLDKIVRLLSRDASDDRMLSKNGRRMHSSQPNIEEEPTFPTFTGADVNVSQKFLHLQKTLVPIEKSLIEILPQRIEIFDSRTFKYTDDLTIILNNKYKVVMVNYKYLTREVRALKIELIDNRWNFVFENLNRELKLRISSVETNYNDLKSQTFSDKISSKQKQKLERDTQIISKTFNTIYKALEFSLLKTDIASEINDLAEVWINLRGVTDEYLETVPSLSDNETLNVIRERAKANREKISRHDLDFFKPPRISSYNSRDDTTTDEEPDAANLTIESIANNLRQFSLASNLKRHDTNDKTLVTGQLSMKKMTKPLIIPSITSTTSGTTVSSEITDELLAMREDITYPSFENRVLNLGTKHGNDKFPPLSGYKDVTSDKLEPPQKFSEPPLMYQLEDNNSDYESDLESSRIDVPIGSLKEKRGKGFLGLSNSESVKSKSSEDTFLEPLVNKSKYTTSQMESIEINKLRYYASQRSLIPRVRISNDHRNNSNISLPPAASVFHTPPRFDYSRSPDWNNHTLQTSARRKLRQPTLMSQLLTPLSRR